MATKLFVGNLPFTATGTELEGLFGQVGSVASANVISDKFTGQSRGFGFVEMNDEAASKKAISELNESSVDGRTIKVMEAKPKEDRGGGGSYGSGKSDRNYNSSNSYNKNRY